MTGFRQTSYYKDGAWKSREWKGDYYTWSGDTESWSFNSSKFWTDVRQLRDTKLYSCDWTQLDDCKLSITKKGEWTEYRQALRDIPTDNADIKELDKIIWPAQPS